MNNVELTTLSNGITVVTKSMKGFESVVSGYWVKAGGVYEEILNCGISHFLEHMAFKGTTTRSAKQIAEEIESVGGYINAYTSKETTAFHAKVLKENLNVSVEILSDILLNSTFAETELKKERNVILQEISQTNDTPDDIIFDYFQNVAFPDQSMGRSILGPTSVVSKISADDLRAYRRKYYNADNIIFGVAGNVSHEEVLNYADKYFSKFSAEKTVKSDCTYQYVGGCYSDVRDLEQAHAIIGFNGVASTDSDYYTLAIFSSILGGGMSSKLFQEVREKRGLVYSIYAFSSSYQRNGLFGIYAATSPDKLEELADVASSEFLKMKFDISEAEFSRTKQQLKASLLMSQESTSSVCEQIANQTVVFGHPIDTKIILEKIDAVSIDDVKKMTDKISGSDVSVVTVGSSSADKMAPLIQKNGLKVK